MTLIQNADGWYDRTIFDTPAEQGFWDNREFTPASPNQQILPSNSELYFTNLMEYNNGTHPLELDSDDRFNERNGASIQVVVLPLLIMFRILILSDGRESVQIWNKSSRQ